MDKIYQHQFDNGLWLVAEPMPGVQSLSMSWLLPAGVVGEPADRQGVAALLAEMVCRGAGGLDAKGHCDALDALGIQRGTTVGTRHFHLGATMLGSKFDPAFGLLADMVRRPSLDESAVGPSRDLALQSLDALEDEPQEKVFYELRDKHYNAPFNRSPLGRREHLEAIGRDQIYKFWEAGFVPDGSILGFAGRFDWDQLKGRVEGSLGDWSGKEAELFTGDPPRRGSHHVEAPTAQAHIGLAYDAVPETDASSIIQRAAVAVLSGGMSGRLFTEVRERRALCYAVYASYAAQKDYGSILAYAGTTVARAQETLDVLAGELVRLSDGVEEGEFARAVVGMKSRLVMQGESTGARARAIASEQHVYGRPRSLDEWATAVDSITLQKLNTFVKDHPPGPMTIVTVGPDPLQSPQVAAPTTAV